jgi:fluoride exporter
MINSLIVMLGGAIGALGRYQFGRLSMHLFGTGWPWGTLGVNVIGGFLMGALGGWLARHGSGNDEPIRLFVGVGILGGFTTFSAFSLETALMIERGELSSAMLYAGASVALSAIALFAGLMLMRAVTGGAVA